MQASKNSLTSPSSTRQSPLFATVAKEGPEDRRKQARLQNDPLLSLNLNLDAMAQNAAAPVAEQMLQRISALHEEGYYEVSPDIVSYNSVLKAWKEGNNPEKALDYLQQMLVQGQAKVDVISFNTVILTFAKQGNHGVARSMIQQMKDRDDLPDPDILTYNALLYALAQSKDSGTTEEAEELLYDLVDGKHDPIQADIASFNTVIHAWSQVASKYNPSAADSAQLLLNRMEQLTEDRPSLKPDVYTYTTVIQAWARCEQSIKAEKLLNTMCFKGLIPNRYTYTAVMSALAKTGMPEKAQGVLDTMMQLYQKGNEALKPDTVSFSCVMDGWARISHVDKPYAADRALDLLEKMKLLESEGMGPNSRTYTSVLSAVAKSGTWEACETARSILQDMEYEANDNGLKKLQPSTIHYNAVLHAYARSPRADKALKAASFLKYMALPQNKHCRPDSISYNSVLMACANAFGNEELKGRSYTIAREMFRKTVHGEDHVRPSSTTFVHFCKASRRLILDKQTRLAALKKAMRLCCNFGMLNKIVVLQAQLACKNEAEWNEISGQVSDYVGWKGKFKPRDVPQKWTSQAGR
ncbi:unnamed protein product [Cylindrotheca closterium]|uniref:Pentacotripeptide-repeat region of PRORP domain-containing protein n=1 Tax=Cylindrotheca closterium TaxID=2856 RepID=A0AAD2G0K1_9STRA|nr:unnamed protein product [Cylindrotheca closterium]